VICGRDESLRRTMTTVDVVSASVTSVTAIKSYSLLHNGAAMDG